MTLAEKAIVGLCLFIAFVVWTGECRAESRVYLGIGLAHYSNIDAGEPFNDDHEDNMDHLGVSVEYQKHLESGYFYTSFGVGHSTHDTRYQSGWDCSGCKLPSALTIGYKLRIN
jgi:hypothetical protein